MWNVFFLVGTQTGSTSSFEHEMSQEGFSATITSVSGPVLNGGEDRAQKERRGARVWGLFPIAGSPGEALFCFILFWQASLVLCFLSQSCYAPFPRMVPCWVLWGALTGQGEPFCTHQRIKSPSSTQQEWIQTWTMLTWVSEEGRSSFWEGVRMWCHSADVDAVGSFVCPWDNCKDFKKNLNLILVMFIIAIP